LHKFCFILQVTCVLGRGVRSAAVEEFHKDWSSQQLFKTFPRQEAKN